MPSSQSFRGLSAGLLLVLIVGVPANVAGRWQLPQGELRLAQQFQMLSGTLTSGANQYAIADGRMRGDQISFHVGESRYSGQVEAGSMQGLLQREWSARKLAE